MTAPTLSNILSKALIIKHLQHSAEGAVVIPVLPAAGYLLCILSAVGRAGINPVPTVDACNTLAINGLSKRLQHLTSVGVGFIPTLAAAVYLLQFLSVAGRSGISPIPNGGGAQHINCRCVGSVTMWS